MFSKDKMPRCRGGQLCAREEVENSPSLSPRAGLYMRSLDITAVCTRE
jgi:hypothetical protein